MNWRLGTVVELLAETDRTASIVLSVADWPGHRAGQHVDVRLTAEDGYQAQRSYSIASGPEDEHLVLTVERLDDGEVSPYLTEELRPGDELELLGAPELSVDILESLDRLGVTQRVGDARVMRQDFARILGPAEVPPLPAARSGSPPPPARGRNPNPRMFRR